MAVVISKLFVIVLWKTVVKERAIHGDKSAGLDTNTDKERHNSLQAGKTRCQVESKQSFHLFPTEKAAPTCPTN